MSSAISIFIFVSLVSVSMLHLAWAFGSTFPAADEKTLARTVTGFRGQNTMPPRLASAFVALATFISAFWPWFMKGQLAFGLPTWFITFGAIILTTVFLARGLIGYTPWFSTIAPEQPFARLNRIYYTPLCLGLGIAFLRLTMDRMGLNP